MAEILIVEDEQILIDVLKRRLTEQGHQVEVTKEGQRALESMREQRPDLVVVEIELTRTDGFTVLEEMNQDSDLEEIPVVIISNSGQPEEIEKAENLGVEDWIIKTEFDPQQAVSKVEQQLNA